MPRKRYSPEEIVGHLRTVEIQQSKGFSIESTAKKIGVSPVTIARWKKEYSGLQVNQVKRLKHLEKENTRLKTLLADAELDKAMYKEALAGNL